MKQYIQPRSHNDPHHWRAQTFQRPHFLFWLRSVSSLPHDRPEPECQQCCSTHEQGEVNREELLLA